MKRFFTLFLAIFLSACTAQTAPDIIAQSALRNDDGVPIILGHTYSVPSKIFGTDRRLSVKLPAGYADSKDKHYPVVYIIDGGPEQDFPHIAGMIASIDISGSLEPVIVVGIETVNRRAEITPPADDVRYDEALKDRGGANDFRRYIRGEVFPWVAAHYRVSEDRAVMGESLAGLFVVDTFLNDPTLFSKYAAISPSLWWDNLAITRPAAQILKGHPAGEREIYLTMANEGLLMQDGLDLLIEALESGAPEGLKWSYIDRRNQESHATIYQPAALDVLRTFFPRPYIEGASPASFYLFPNGEYPELTESAKKSLEGDCTHENARPTSFAAVNANWAQWNGHCVLIKPGPPRTKGN
ncbi:MAG: alpha/beta hydrolase-fold protein [Robiginitomaculum sp.]